MLFLEASYQLKVRTEILRKLVSVVSLDLQAAAPLGTAGAEGRHNDMSPNPQGFLDGVQVFLSIGFFDQEVKHSPVVPDVDRLR